MKSSNKKGFAKQLVSAGVYIALAAAVVGVSTNAVVSIFSDNIKKVEVPDSTKNTKYEIRDITLPEITPFPEFEDIAPDTPVSGNQEGVSSDVTEKTATVEELPDESTVIEETEITEPDFGYPGYVSPCDGFVTREFSPDVLVYSPTMYDYRVHMGTDIACELATPVKAISGGTVTEVCDDSLLGKSVTIESGDGLIICYRNLSDALPQEITEGAVIKTGDIVGAVGKTALSESAEEAHVHIEASLNGEFFDVTTLY